MKPLITAAILLVSLTNVMAQPSVGTVVVQPSPMPRQTTATATTGVSTNLNSVEITGNQPLGTGDLEQRASETVLVVPGPDLKPDVVAALTQDLTVMCRIFDKALYPSARLRGTAGVYVRRPGALSQLLMQPTGRTGALYLDGYGAVFFVPLDFPLAPPPDQNEQPKPQESADRVWSQTLDELRGQPDDHEADEVGPAYDAQKVEKLKATLIKTLRHAANLRLRPQDHVTIVAGSPNRAGSDARQQLSAYGYSLSSGHGRRRPAPTTASRADNPATPDPAATLVLRVAKSDVDALAAGQLTADQFAPKVATFWSWTQPQAPEPPSTTPPVPTPAPAPR